MNLIAAVDRNWAIGLENRLLNSIPEDMKFFRTTTMGKTVIMGRKTLESFPGAKPLKNRRNIVITKDAAYEKEGVVIVHSVEEALAAAADTPGDEVYVIGGESIYRQMLPYCDRAYITFMDHAFEADTWFPDLSADPDWVLFSESQRREHEGIEYLFRVYQRKNTISD